MRNVKLWCTICSIEGHTKYTCHHNDSKIQYVRVVHTQCYFQIYQDFTLHETKNFPLNLMNLEIQWCTIYEYASHDTKDYALNMRNKKRYHIVYQTFTIDQKRNLTASYRNDANSHRGSYKG